MSEELSLPQKAAGWPAQFKSYVDELKLEMKRVSWPNWQQVRATTIVVIASVFAFAAYFAVLDKVLQATVQRAYNYLVR